MGSSCSTLLLVFIRGFHPGILKTDSCFCAQRSLLEHLEGFMGDENRIWVGHLSCQLIVLYHWPPGTAFGRLPPAFPFIVSVVGWRVSHVKCSHTQDHVEIPHSGMTLRVADSRAPSQALGASCLLCRYFCQSLSQAPTMGAFNLFI